MTAQCFPFIRRNNMIKQSVHKRRHTRTITHRHEWTSRRTTSIHTDTQKKREFFYWNSSVNIFKLKQHNRKSCLGLNAGAQQRAIWSVFTFVNNSCNRLKKAETKRMRIWRGKNRWRPYVRRKISFSAIPTKKSRGSIVNELTWHSLASTPRSTQTIHIDP